MYFDSLDSLWRMDGHGLYVWGAYLCGAVTLVWNMVAPWWRQRTTVATLCRQQRREENP